VTWWARLALVLVVVVAACGDNEDGDDRQGGATTVDDRTGLAFTHFASNLTLEEIQLAQAGKGPFGFKWEPPVLGPVYNNDACAGCHALNGRGLSQIGPDFDIDDNGANSQSLVRCSLVEGAPGDPGGPIPVPGFGTQLQDHAIGAVPEVHVTLAWEEHTELYGDGTQVTLRAPHLTIVTPDGNPLSPDILTSYREAPAIIGLGLLEAVDAGTLEALADPDDADGDGISGKINHVWDPIAQATVIGRFGWKANVADLALQVAGAFAGDIGLSNKVFPDGDQRDLSDDQLDQTTFFASVIAVPAAGPRDATAYHGRSLFRSMGCASCHIPTLVTGDHPIPELAHQTIHPYTDLLVHDMGDMLTDSRSDFEATGREWRTPALWGIGLTQLVQQQATFLHDGRARTLEEAILWHGGEAEAAREAFRTAPAKDREALIAFLKSL
jgi:CxxC motif-containing protein (DUF1111 family)